MAKKAQPDPVPAQPTPDLIWVRRDEHRVPVSRAVLDDVLAAGYVLDDTPHPPAAD